MFLINFLADKVHGTSQTAWCMVLTGLAAGYAIKRYLAPSPLARIPGPPSSSFFTGHLLLLAAGKNDMRFCNQITEQYGGVVKLNTLFGVCHFCSSYAPVFAYSLSRATRYIYRTHLLYSLF